MSQGDAFGTSGILLSDGWILSHGTLLSPTFSKSCSQDLFSFFAEVEENLDWDLIPVPRRLSEAMKMQLQYNRVPDVAHEKSK
jgi:hypothetical protein